MRIGKIFAPDFLEGISIYESLSLTSTRPLSDSVKIIEGLVLSGTISKQDCLSILEALSVFISSQKNDSVLVTESLNFSTMFFTEKSDNIAISENLVITIESGSNIVNGSQINGAII